MLHKDTTLAVGGSITVQLTSCLACLDLTKPEKLFFIFILNGAFPASFSLFSSFLQINKCSIKVAND